VLDARLAILGGYTARSAEVRNHHIEELRQIGIEPSERIPAFWPITTSLLVVDEDIQVQGFHTSGEIEFALLFAPEGVLVALASDQTDRAFEVHSIPRSKQLCPKVLSRDVIPLAELLDVWDEIVIRSEVLEADGSWIPYQHATLELVMPIEPMLASAFGGQDPPLGTVLLSGTVPLVDGVTRYAGAFRGAMEVPGWDGALTISYGVEMLPDHPTELASLSSAAG
jgi:hypothetical protein